MIYQKVIKMPVINTILTTVWHNTMNTWLQQQARNQNTPALIIIDANEWERIKNNLSKDVTKWTD